MVTRARITSKGQITVPKAIRDRLGIGPGDSLEFHFEDGHLEVRPVRRRSITELRGLFEVEEALDFEEERRIAWEARVRRLMERLEKTDA